MSPEGRSRRWSRRLIITLAVTAMLGMLLGGTAGAQEEPQPVAEAARLVTQDPNPAAVYPIPTIAVHPDDPETVVVAVGEARQGGCFLFASRDAGLSWVRSAQLLPEGFDHCIHRNFGRYMQPTFASDGTLYIALNGTPTGAQQPNGRVAALMARTSNLGRTHETFMVAEAFEEQVTQTPSPSPTATGQPPTETLTLPGQHKYASVAVAPDDPQVVYRSWERGLAPPSTFGFDVLPPNTSKVAVSTDGGQSWETTDLTQVALDSGAPEGSQVTDATRLVTAPDGTVHAFGILEPPEPEAEDASAPNDVFYMFTSDDQGQSWSAQEIYGGAPTVDMPEPAVDPNNGNLYLTWLQRDQERPAPLRVKFMASTDGGESWSDPTQVVDPQAGDDWNQYNPAVSVAPNGRIDLTWEDFRNDPASAPGNFKAEGSEVQRFSNIFYNYSTDGGRTFSQDLKVSDEPIDRELGVTFAGAMRGPVAIDSSNGAAHIAWPDTRAGDDVTSAEDTYYSRVRMQPNVQLAGAEADDTGPNALGIGIGAGAALLLAGLVMAGVVRSRRGSAAGEG